MSESYSIHVTTKPVVSEYHTGPTSVTHKGKRYRVQSVIVSCDVTASFLGIYVPLKLPGGSFGNRVVWIYHHLNYTELTKAQRKRFFPRRYFTKTWGKNFRFPKAA